MNTFKNYGCPKGAPGAMGVDYAQLEKTISFAMHQFMAKREEILLGGKPEPPEVTGYKVYIYYNGGAAEFWLWREKQWVKLREGINMQFDFSRRELEKDMQVSSGETAKFIRSHFGEASVK